MGGGTLQKELVINHLSGESSSKKQKKIYIIPEGDQKEQFSSNGRNTLPA